MNKNKFKKIIFYSSCAMVIIFMVEVVKILIYDLMNLTAYGWGYLVGTIAFAFLFLSIAVVTRKRKMNTF